MPFSLAGSILCGVGIGAGPMLDATLRWHLPDISERGSHAAPAFCLAAVWVALTAAAFFLVPQHLAEESCDNMDAVANDSSAADKAHVSRLADMENKAGGNDGLVLEEPQISSRQTRIWVHAAVIGMERALIVSALEAASSLLLEIKYGFSRKDVGLAVGCTFVLGTPLMVCLGQLQNHAKLSDVALLCVLTLVTALPALLFVQGVGSALASNVPGYWWILLADSLLFPTAYTASGLAEGMLLQHSQVGTLFSAENYTIVNAVLEDGVGRFVGPVLARWLIKQADGQDAYALLQLGLCGLAFGTSLHLYHISHKCDS